MRGMCAGDRRSSGRGRGSSARTLMYDELVGARAGIQCIQRRRAALAVVHHLLRHAQVARGVRARQDACVDSTMPRRGLRWSSTS
jgi:hypothetical protein